MTYDVVPEKKEGDGGICQTDGARATPLDVAVRATVADVAARLS